MVQSDFSLKAITADISLWFPNHTKKLVKNLNDTKKLVKNLIHTKHQSLPWTHIKDLSMQGEFCRHWEIQDSDFTWKADLHNLSCGVAKFLINSVVSSNQWQPC